MREDENRRLDRTTKRVKDKKLAFFFLSEEERKDFAKRNFNPLASAIKIKKAFRSFFIFICERMRTVG